MRKLFASLIALLLFGAGAMAQTIQVTGRVLDSTGSGLSNASIREKGGKAGTSAGSDGTFRLTVRQGATLIISSIGYAQREVAASTNVTVSLSANFSSNITEVIVTGAFNTKRTARSTTYNAQVVSDEKLNTIRQTNVNNALAGKVAGIQVRSQSTAALGRNTGIRLRGATGLGGGEDVIYVVDGTILPNADDINLDEVENISVLQGPSASALFGSQGANGAIVITMKKGRKSPGVGVNVNIGATFENVYVLPNYQNSYAGGGVADLMKYTWKTGDPEEWKALDGKFYHDYSDDASWGPRMVGQEYIPWYAWYGGTKYSYKTTYLNPVPDNARDYFNTGVTLNNSVSFSKSSDAGSMRMSYSNVAVTGLVPTTSLNKNVFNLSGTLNITKRLSATANINYINQKVNGEIGDEYSNQSTGSFNSWFHRDLDMNIMKELRGLKTSNGVYASWNHSNPNTYNPATPNNFYAGNYWYNFYTWFDLNKVVNNRDRLFGDVALNYKVTNDLNIKATYRKQQNTTWGEQMFRSELATSQTQATGNEARNRGFYSSANTYSNRQNIELLISYNKKFNDFQVNANAGSDFFRALSRSNGGNTNQGLIVPNLFTLQNSVNAASISNSRVKEQYRALFAQANLGYKNLVFVDGTVRKDWYSTLPVANNDVLSKSFGASFIFSDLVKNSISWLSYGKVRASWGEIPKALGTTATTFGAYRYPGLAYGVGAFPYGGTNIIMSTPDQVVDSAIHGAVITQREIGIDLRFLKDRIGISATYWDGTESDIPQTLTVDPTSGYSSKLANAGKMTKKGIELQLNLRPIWMKDLRWELNATTSKLIEQKVIDLGPGIDRSVNIEATYSTSTPYLLQAKGQPWGQIYGAGIKRMNGKPVLTSAGLYTSDPNTYFGNVLPKYTGGLQNSFTVFKNFTANVNIDYQVGGKFFSLSDMWGSYSGLTARTAAINDRGESVRTAVADGGGVHVVGVDATGKDVDYYVPAQTYFQQSYNNKVFDEFIYDLTFVKLREVSIGYDIPVKKLGWAKWATSANFSLVARSPLLIYAETKDFDPSEISRISGEQGQFPGTRGIGFNLKLGF